ncbi:MAG: hypothetical protein IIV80_04225, partial [Clostridia bacterium]|nr:hypothetical protein [Clostridia bacterium]
MEDGHIGLDGCGREAGLKQLVLHTLLTDFVILIKDDEGLVIILLGKSRLFRHALEHAAVVDHNGVSLHANAIQEERGNIDQLALCIVGGISQNVNITLSELAEAALLRAVCTPDRANLQRFEGSGE